MSGIPQKTMMHIKRQEKSQSEETNQPWDQDSYRTEILELSGKEVKKPQRIVKGFHKKCKHWQYQTDNFSRDGNYKKKSNGNVGNP